MNISIITSSLLIIIFACSRPLPSGDQEQSHTDNVMTYDSLIAAELGADEYGMKTYIFAFLKQGPVRDQDSATVAVINRGHLDNITRLAEEGKLVLAGPFLDDGEVRGIFVFNVATLEEAEALINTDPAIQSGRLIMELHPWYGSASLQQISETQSKITKKKI